MNTVSRRDLADVTGKRECLLGTHQALESILSLAYAGCGDAGLPAVAALGIQRQEDQSSRSSSVT